MNTKRLLILVGLAVVVVCGCLGVVFLVGSGTDREGTGQVAGGPAVNTPRPTFTPEPGAVSTATPVLPTPTPEPPTPTPVPPTPTTPPEPIVLEGQGDSIVDVNKWEGPALVRVEGNAESRHFAVLTHGGDYPDAIVNTTDVYRGVRLIDFEDSLTSRFEVNAEGGWRIEVLPLSEARVLVVPGMISGEGDEVLILDGVADLATIRGNEAERHFAVMTHGDRFPDAIVNTTDPYEGTVIVGSETTVLEVLAVGGWTIEVVAP